MLQQARSTSLLLALHDRIAPSMLQSTPGRACKSLQACSGHAHMMNR
jgi:hypothetical protein